MAEEAEEPGAKEVEPRTDSSERRQDEDSDIDSGTALRPIAAREVNAACSRVR